MFKKRRRIAHGSAIVELAPALYVVFLMITFPMIAFGWVGVRYVILANAANLAAQQASKARCFATTIPAGTGSPVHYSAVKTAQTVATMAVSNMGGGTVALNPINSSATSGVLVYIKIRPISAATTAPTQPAANTPLSASLLNPTLYTYTCEVICNGTISPMFPYWSGLTGIKIPLLNQAISVSTRADYVFENNLNLSI